MGLFSLVRKKRAAGYLGLEVGPFGIAVAHLRPLADGHMECRCHFVEGIDLKDNCKELKAYLSEQGIEDLKADVVLHPNYYELHFVDRPEVEDDELDEAVRWKIKDLVHTPLQDLMVDAFAIPNDAYRGNVHKVYAVTTPRVLIEDIARQLSVEVPISSIGISELAARDVLNMLYDDEGSTALLRLRSSQGTINLCDHGELYFVRSLESGITAIEGSRGDAQHAALDSMVLEIQRCLDFYDSQLGKGAIRRFVVAPTRFSADVLLTHIRDQIGLHVEALDINKMFLCPENIPLETQGECFAALGAICKKVVH